jgi:hypothetical protein
MPRSFPNKKNASSKSTDDTSSTELKIWLLVWRENEVFYSKTHFQSIFNFKHLGNILGILLNQSMTSKNTKKVKNPNLT